MTTASSAATVLLWKSTAFELQLAEPPKQLHSIYRHLPVKNKCSEVLEALPVSVPNSLSSSALDTFTTVPAVSLEKGLDISPEVLVL